MFRIVQLSAPECVRHMQFTEALHEVELDPGNPMKVRADQRRRANTQILSPDPKSR